MFDDLFEKPHPRKIDELNVVPILDMLMSVIFFLLLSTTLIGYTKLEIPPAKISEAAPSDSEPISPKMIIKLRDGLYEFKIKWGGAKPSSLVENVAFAGGEVGKELELKIREACAKVAADFLNLYPNEKTLQLGLSENIDYQILISTMDGLKTQMSDVVLISYEDVKKIEKE